MDNLTNLTIRRADDGREESPELAHVPVIRRKPVHVEALRVERNLDSRDRGFGSRVSGSLRLFCPSRAAARAAAAALHLEPVAVEGVTVANLAALEDVPGLQRRRLALVEDERVPLEFT